MAPVIIPGAGGGPIATGPTGSGAIILPFGPTTGTGKGTPPGTPTPGPPGKPAPGPTAPGGNTPPPGLPGSTGPPMGLPTCACVWWWIKIIHITAKLVHR